MITENIKSFTDEEIINLINKIVMGEEQAELSDLKAILAEASGRKLEKNYINIIAERIKEKIAPVAVEQKRKSEPEVVKEKSAEEKTKFNFDAIYNNAEDDFEDEDEKDDEKYPVLSFMTGLYKAFAWIMFIGLIAISVVVSMVFFANNIAAVCMTILAGIVLSVIMLLAFLAASESIRIKIEIENHLSQISEAIKKG